MKNNLFNLGKLKQLCYVEPTEEQFEVIKEWKKLLDEKKLVFEVKNYMNFAFKFLNKLLGYNEDYFSFEEGAGSGRVEFSIKKPEDTNYRLIIELKGQNIELDKTQRIKGKHNRSAVDQAFYYAFSKKGVQWIIVSNYEEIRLYNYHKKRKYISFKIEELHDKEILQLFLCLFSKKCFLDEQIPDVALKESLLAEKTFSNDFYRLYHVTRLEILNQLIQSVKESTQSMEKIISIAQILLNRIVFIAFAENYRLLPSELLVKTIKSPIDTKDVAKDRKEVWHKLNLLFSDINKGKVDKNISEYNGGLFQESLENVTFNDLKPYDPNNVAYKHNFEYDSINPLLNVYKNSLNPIFKNFLLFGSINYKDEVTVDILGHVFEQSIIDIEKLQDYTSLEGLMTDIKKIKPENEKKGELGRKKRKKEGIFYTPEMITSEITKSAIVHYLSSNTAAYTLEGLLDVYKDNINDLDKKVKELKICDIACGSGAFLSQATDILIELREKILDIKDKQGFFDDKILKRYSDKDKIKIDIVQENLFGADINSNSIEIAQLALFLRIANKNYKLPDLSKNFFIGNSVISDETVVSNPIKWENITHNQFHIIITNPPYIPTEKLDEKEREFFSNNYSVFRKYETSVIFIEKALDLLVPGGVIGFIVPLTWQTGSNYAKFRDVLFKNAKLIKLINLPFDIFPEAYVDTCIVIFEKNKHSNEDFFLAYQFGKNEKIATLHINNWERIPMNRIISHNEKCVYSSDSFYSLLDKINSKILEGNFQYLGEITNSTQGLHAGRYKRNKISKTKDDIPFYEKGTTNRHFMIIEEETFVNKLQWENLKGMCDKFYELPKVFIRRIINRQDRLMAFFVENRLLTTKDYNPFVLKSDGGWNTKVNYNYLTAILNSKLISFIYINFSAIALKDDFRQTTLTNLRKLPIAIADQPIQLLLADIQKQLSTKLIEFQSEVDKVVSTITAKYEIKGKSKILNFYNYEIVEIVKEIKNLDLSQTEEFISYIKEKKKKIKTIIKNIREFEKTIDNEIYILYDITPEESLLIESRLIDKI